jgi:predicted metal-binding transcription factor (methanogenesis marker protein 9)
MGDTPGLKFGCTPVGSCAIRLATEKIGIIRNRPNNDEAA